MKASNIVMICLITTIILTADDLKMLHVCNLQQCLEVDVKLL